MLNYVLFLFQFAISRFILKAAECNSRFCRRLSGQKIPKPAVT